MPPSRHGSKKQEINSKVSLNHQELHHETANNFKIDDSDYQTKYIHTTTNKICTVI